MPNTDKILRFICFPSSYSCVSVGKNLHRELSIYWVRASTFITSFRIDTPTFTMTSRTRHVQEHYSRTLGRLVSAGWRWWGAFQPAPRIRSAGRTAIYGSRYYST